MEFEEAHNNLRAIRLLYRLLEDNSIDLQDANSENQVVERARVLLKSLLNVAVEVVFETHLKMTTTQAGISKTISDTEGIKSKALCEENCMMQHSLVNTTNQSNEKDISPNLECNHHEQQHENVNSLCGVGEHAKESLQMFGAKAGESNEGINVPLMNHIGQAESNSSAVRLVESLEQKGDFSDDLVNTITRIESRILAFQLCSNMVDSNKKDNACHYPLHKEANLGSPKMQRKDSAAGSHLSCRKSLFEGHRLVNHQTDKSSCKGENLISANAFKEPLLAGNESLSQSQVVYQNYGLHTMAESAKSVYIPKQIGTQLVSSREELRRGTRIQTQAQNMAMIDRVKSLNRLVSGDAHFGSQPCECIQGLRVPLNQDDLNKKPSMFDGQPNRQTWVRKNPVAWSNTDQNQKEKSYESSHAQKLGRSTPPISRREKLLPHQMVIKPTLLDQRSSEIKVNSHQHRDMSFLDRRRGTHKTGHVEPQKTRSRARPQLNESEESISIHDSSSQWTSQQGSTNISNSDYEDSLAVGTQGPKSGRIVDSAYEGSSEESSDSYLYRDDSPSHRVGSIKSYKHSHKRSPKKTTGGLKRLKNKLGLIFHHHHHHQHHHHHHHYHDDDDDDDDRLSNASHRHSMWNQLQNVFHHKNKHVMLTNKKVEKTRRGAITSVLPRSNPVGQFHRHVEGLMRHIWHSKKPKPSKHGRNRNTRQKKRHWWQIPRRRRGVKLKNRGRVKMGFISQKSLKN